MKDGIKTAAGFMIVLFVIALVLSLVRAGAAFLSNAEAQSAAEAARANAVQAQAEALREQALADRVLNDAIGRQMDAATGAVVADTRAAHSPVRAVAPVAAIAGLVAALLVTVLALFAVQAQKMATLAHELQKARLRLDAGLSEDEFDERLERLVVLLKGDDGEVE